MSRVRDRVLIVAGSLAIFFAGGLVAADHRPVSIIFATVGLWWIIASRPSASAAVKATRPPLCRVCGYDLRATPHRCPECGTVPAGIA